MVPGATVTLKHLDTGRVTEAVSNENGLYLLSALQPGSYEVTFTLAGFQTVVVKGIELHVNDRLEVNGKLGVTAVSETVEVSAASQFVQPHARGAEPDGADAGPGAAAQQPQLRRSWRRSCPACRATSATRSASA